jgi:hypothetical protein
MSTNPPRGKVLSLAHSRRKKQQLRTTSSGGDGGGADYHNQLYKLTESVQSLEEKVVHVERMLRKLLRLLRNTSQRDQSP